MTRRDLRDPRPARRIAGGHLAAGFEVLKGSEVIRMGLGFRVLEAIRMGLGFRGLGFGV